MKNKIEELDYSGIYVNGMEDYDVVETYNKEKIILSDVCKKVNEIIKELNEKV